MNDMLSVPYFFKKKNKETGNELLVTAQLRIRASLWWSKNCEVRFFWLKIQFSTHFHRTTPNNHHKSLFKSHTKLKISQNHSRKPKSIEPYKSKWNSVSFSGMFTRKTRCHRTLIVEWNLLTLRLIICFAGIATTNYFISLLSFFSNFLSPLSNSKTRK
jgi:hypothetical protein